MANLMKGVECARPMNPWPIIATFSASGFHACLPKTCGRRHNVLFVPICKARRIASKMLRSNKLSATGQCLYDNCSEP